MHGSQLDRDTIVLPQFASIVHCHLHCNQFLTAYQPRFEDGQISRCTSNGLQLSVYDHTDIVLFLTGQLEIFDLFQIAPKGCVAATWKVATDMSNKSNFPHEFVRQNLTSAGKNLSPAKSTPTERINEHVPSPHLAPQDLVPPHSHQRKQKIRRELKTPPSSRGSDRLPAMKEDFVTPSPGSNEGPWSATTPKGVQDILDALVRQVPIPRLPGANSDCTETLTKKRKGSQTLRTPNWWQS